MFAFVVVFAGSSARGDESVRAALESAAVHLHFGRPDAALVQLEKVEAVEPNNPWLWYYKGVARNQQERHGQAVVCFERAEQILHDLGDPDADLVRRVRADCAHARRELLEFTVAVGLAYDSNVAYAGDASSLGLVSGRGDAKFLNAFGVDALLAGDGRTKLTTGLHAVQSWPFDLDVFDDQRFGGYLRLERKLDDRWSAAIRFDHDFTLLGHDPFLFDNALTTSLTYSRPLSEQAIQLSDTIVYHRFEVRDYLYSTRAFFDQDATHHALGVEQSFLWRPIRNATWTWDLRAGYEVENVETQGHEYDRLDHTVHVGAVVPLIHPSQPDEYLVLPDKELTLGIDVNWRIEDYRHASRIDRTHDRRYDDIASIGIALSQTLWDDPQRGRLILHAFTAFSSADSAVEMSRNAGPFTYEKHVFGFQLQWSF